MDQPVTKKLRHVVIGAGALVFGAHKPALELETTQVVAVCDINPEKGKPQAEAFNCPFYTDYRQMLVEVEADVAVIMTPHYLHASMAIDCLKSGCHVLVEKPMALHAAEADAMIAAADKNKRLLAVNFQQRLRPEVLAAFALLKQGCLGALQRLTLIVPWPRSAVYYKLGTWRAKWKGEGGGVLMNQAPHDLDLICHLMGGMPSKVFAWNRTLLHQIEVEDTVSAMMEWDNGDAQTPATGYLHVSTAESGSPNDLEIVGSKGVLQIGRGKLGFSEFETDVRDYLMTTKEPFGGPEPKPAAVELGNDTGDHPAVYRNFHAAILQGSPVSADGRQGRMSLELANGMIYSQYTHSEVSLPISREKYAALLADLQQKGADL